MKKVALITGITGQTGSYLAEHLLSMGYEVHGIVRRSSSFNTGRIDHIFDKLQLHYGDLTDATSLNSILTKTQPDEIYNLGAQSHVKVSFEIPAYSVESVGLGAQNLFEAVRTVGLAKKSRIYQAGSSEMFGASPSPQSEVTPFLPQSPYACAKVFAHYTGRLYREAYGMFVCSGMLFNHESVLKNSPVMILNNGSIDILPIEDLFKSEGHRYEGILDGYVGAKIWNGEEWTEILSGTCYQEKDKGLRLIQTRESCCETTEDHFIFKENNKDVANKDLKIGDSLFSANYPEQIGHLNPDLDLVKFIGFVCGDGYISDAGRVRLTGKDTDLLKKFASLVLSKFGWSSRISKYTSGYDVEVYQLDMNNDSHWGLWLRNAIYTKNSKEKKVPSFVLNGSTEVKKSFYDGYYEADGRKAGNEKYHPKGFTSSSATLTLGLNYIFKAFSQQKIKCKCEYRDGRRYYRVQYRCPQITTRGKSRMRKLNEIITITDTKSVDGWFFDLQTKSETFATGPNLCKIHNSPRRGETFVTRKITKAVARIKHGKQDKLHLGNLDARRDWGFAGDYSKAMHLMLQHNTPDDYVVATGESHTVQEFVEESFSYAGLDWKKYVVIDPKYFRPAEVDDLRGDSSKIKRILGWEPKVKFKELCHMMVDSDLGKESLEIRH